MLFDEPGVPAAGAASSSYEAPLHGGGRGATLPPATLGRLLRASFTTPLPDALAAELRAICSADPLPPSTKPTASGGGYQPPPRVEGGEEAPLLAAAVALAFAPLVGDGAAEDVHRLSSFWFALLDRDADGELGSADLFFWLRAVPPSLQPLIERLIGAHNNRWTVTPTTFAGYYETHSALLPTALPYDRILERLRREIGEPDIGAVRAISELPAELHRHFRAHFTRILDAFKKMDTDGDGLLSKAELVAAVAELGLPRAYGAHAPFNPTPMGANARFIKKPQTKQVEI